ncbi:4'-phosphopantetheinyl transferase superfamily protein [Dyella sp. 2HG41-7]|uniref:4'-phosphopantetheinyl transferase family protein n=1 Tax=Dyella sp. 2HG41-7 TaxID=2883239 RepID=UPI001F41AEA4|nr:4'-phosphopantetheinyl transferase superfamily protein [Dyella sp. 2HG41-7]
MNDPANTYGETCPIHIVRAAPSALWQEARDACDDALARDYAFVAILHGMEAFADDQILTDKDRERAARYRQPGDRHNFVLGRNLVHHFVRPCGISTPCEISVGARGKPFLPDAHAYNVSHSGRWVACIVHRDDSVGIDVETFVRMKNYRDLIEVITHPTERRYIEQAPTEHRLALFKRCWTRKEAVLKATGEGLRDNLQTIDVNLAQNEPVLDQPMPLRVMHLATDQDDATIALALNPSVRGVVAMFVGEPR